MRFCYAYYFYFPNETLEGGNDFPQCGRTRPRLDRGAAGQRATARKYWPASVKLQRRENNTKSAKDTRGNETTKPLLPSCKCSLPWFA